MSEFYDINSTKVSLKEYWDEANVLAVIGWVLKTLRVRTPCSTDDPNVDSTHSFLVHALPDWVMAEFQPIFASLETLGFHSPVFHFINDPGTQTTVYWATLQHQSGAHFARIHRRNWDRAANVKRKPFVMFFTGFMDGTFLVSSSGKPDLAVPPTVDLKRKTGAKPEALWAFHEQRRGATGRQDFVAVSNRDELLWSVERHHILLRDFNLARGVFCPRSANAKAQADAYAARVETARASGSSYPEVMAHLDALEQKKPGWGSALWVLLGSAILFLAAGAAQWDWKFTLWLIPVLFFHEAGHWIAMRIFKYRNLRMFFIPFFGAAVTGQNWNVPGWKKVLVSLAGPLPGIALGCALTVVAFFVHQSWLDQLALILLLLNGFNLLPILPLDGGHVLHATLFCRNRWLDGAFRVLAVLGLTGLAVTGSGRFMIALVVFMALSLPVAFKLGKVTDELRRTALPPPLPGEDKIPTATAQAIIGAVQAALPKNASHKMLAQHTINVFESLNARPPGVLATIGLLALHAGGVLLAIIFGSLAVVNMHGGMKDFFKAAIRQPAHSFKCGATSTWNGPGASEGLSTSRNLLAVTLEDHQAAATAFAGLTNRLPASSRLVLFGESLLLVLPAADDAAREQWFDELQNLSTNLFVAPSNRSVSVTFQFIPPPGAAATNLVQQLGDYFDFAGPMHLIPPWSPQAREAGFARYIACRRELQELQETLTRVWKDPAMVALDQKIKTASRRGSQLQKLYLEREQLGERLRAEAYARIRQSPTNRFDPALLELSRQRDALSYTNTAARAALNRQLAAKLGEVEYSGDHPAPGADAYSAAFGHVTTQGMIVELSASLNEADTGLPALAEWLCQQHCGSLRYELRAGFSVPSWDEEEEE